MTAYLKKHFSQKKTLFSKKSFLFFFNRKLFFKHQLKKTFFATLGLPIHQLTKLNLKGDK